MIKPAINFGKELLKGTIRTKLKKQLEQFIEDYFGNTIISTIAEFILHVIEENYDKMGNLSLKKIGEFIIKKITRRKEPILP